MSHFVFASKSPMINRKKSHKMNIWLVNHWSQLNKKSWWVFESDDWWKWVRRKWKRFWHLSFFCDCNPIVCVDFSTSLIGLEHRLDFQSFFTFLKFKRSFSAHQKICAKLSACWSVYLTQAILMSNCSMSRLIYWWRSVSSFDLLFNT